MIVEYRPTFEESFVEDDFRSGNVKTYIDELMEKTNIIPRIQILPEIIENNKAIPDILTSTLDNVLSLKIEPNADPLKKRRDRNRRYNGNGGGHNDNRSS